MCGVRVRVRVRVCAHGYYMCLQADVATLRRELDAARTELRDKSTALVSSEAASRNARQALADAETLREQLARGPVR